MYVYRGKHTIAAETARKTAKCGTPSGYQKHHRERTLACEPCLKAHRAAVAESRKARGIPERTKAKCGTVSGYNTHLQRKEATCDDCKKALNEYTRERRKRADVREKNREYMRQYRAQKKAAA